MTATAAPQASKHWPASIYRRPDGEVERCLAPARLREIVRAGEGELWVDVDSNDLHQHALLEKVLEFHPLAVEDTLSPRTRVKLEEYDRYVFVVMAGFQFDQATPDPFDLQTSNLYFFLGKNFLVTVHAMPSMGCNAARDRLLRSPDLLARGAEMTMHHIIDQAVDSYFPLVEELNGMVDGLEQKLFEEFDEGLIHEIFKAKRSTFGLETYLSQTSNRMNRVMKQLSIVATVALPLIVIAGIYGMNFSRMPLIHDALGFWVAVASMAGVSLAIVWWLKHRQWL